MIDGQKNVLCTDETKPTDRVPEDVPSDTVILDLNGNQLEIIRENDFAGLDFLINLNVSYSKVSSIEDKAFSHTKNLEFLDLSNNELTMVNLQQLRNLRELDLSHNSFKVLPTLEEESGVYLPLVKLDISHNPFTSIQALSLPDTIKHLDISCYKSRTFAADSLDNQVDLETLIIRGHN